MPFSKLHIVLVDDNILDRDIALMAISKLNLPIEVIHFKNGQEALEFIQSLSKGSKDIHLMISDLHMPIKDGYEILGELQDSPLKTFPVVVMSSSSMLESREYLFELGASAVYEKPFGYTRAINLFRKIINEFVLKRLAEPNQSLCA